MIKYVVLPEQRKVIGYIDGTKNDAIKKIMRLTHGTGLAVTDCKKYVMPDCFKAEVVCDPEDEWNEEEGKRIAKERVMKRYYKSFHKKMNIFYNKCYMLTSIVLYDAAKKRHGN